MGGLMISRKSAIKIANTYNREFVYTNKTQSIVQIDLFYDFLYERDYDTWFCNLIKTLPHHGYRTVKEFIMRIHTGESLYNATKSWTWEQRRQLGQRYLHDLSEDMLNYWHELPEIPKFSIERIEKEIKEMISILELDGYIYKNNMLLTPESDVLDIKEEKGVIESLYLSLNLNNKQVADHHLSLSEQHYIDGKWDDSISNSRKFLECVLREVATAHSMKYRSIPLGNSKFESPVAVRTYLEDEGMLESKEKKAISSVYQLLSSTGGHPYMANNDQARLLRHLSLTFSQFVMLRLEGKFNSSP